MPSNISVLNSKRRKAQQYLQSRNYEAARTLYTEICKLDSDDADSWYMLGAIAIVLGSANDAIEYSKKTISLRPDYLGAYYNLAKALLSTNKAEETIEICLKAISIRNNYPDIYSVLGLAYEALGKHQAAIESLQKAITIDPYFIDAYFYLGTVFQATGKIPEATESYLTVTRLNPDDARAHIKLAFIYINSDQASKALTNLTKLLELEPEDATLHHDMGTTLLMTGDSSGATIHFERAIELDPKFADAYYGLGDVYLRNARLDDLRHITDLMNEHLADHPFRQLLLAKLERREKNFQSASKRLQDLLIHQQQPGIASKIHHELGQTLDSLGQYADAFNEFDTAQKTFVASSHAATHIDSQSFYRTISTNRNWFIPDNTANWINQKPEDNVSAPVFLVGFPRSGTTLSEQILASHQNVLVSDERPILVNLLNQIPSLLHLQAPYPDVLNILTPAHLTTLRKRYWELCEDVTGSQIGEKLFIDKLPLNTIHLGFINKIFPEAKILIAIRDPRDVCLSCFMQMFHLNEAMIQFTDIKSTALAYSAVMDLLAHYRKALQLDTFEYRYEDIVADTESTARKMLTFLGLEWDENVLSFYRFERKRTITTPSVEAVASPIYSRSIGRWQNYEKQMEPALLTLRPYVKNFGYKE